ncbi:hypothetical protein [Pimelobacter simplex]|uniref:hypothetical protein n=1 Tax=Nocardioides simplex TaxID=2045 RepID=UPI001934AA2C|nr:hypothetical protein [Pimelobacter simplex]
MLSIRRPALLVAATLLVLTTGCSSDGDGTDAGGAKATAAPTTPPRTAPAPTIDAELSAGPQGRAIEAWAAAYARAINEGDHAFAGVADVPAVREWMERHAAPEWGRYFPGPLPVAQLGMRPSGTTEREVEACVLVSGWSQESRTVRRTRSRDVVGMTFRLASSAGGWRVERITSATIDCRGVVPPARNW